MWLQPMKALGISLMLASGTGCIAAAGAGLGAGIYLSDRGAESLVSSPIDKTFAASQEVFREMGITEVKSSGEQTSSAEERQIDGKRGDKNVKVTLKTEGEGTRVEVVASEDMVVWDKDLAREVLEQIVKKTK
jgi:hypothetical protein